MSVRQKLGMIFRIQLSLSPPVLVLSIILNNMVIMGPIPPKTKCKNIVKVYAMVSLVNKKEVAYVNGVMASG